MLPMTRRTTDSPFDMLHREIDRAFDRLWQPGQEPWSFAGSYPVDIHEDDESLTVEAELPGFKKDEIEVTMEQGVLTITAQRRGEQEQEVRKGEQHLSERHYRKLQRSFRLPSAVDENNIDASLHEGVLTLRLPKREEVKPRKIEVK